MSNKLTELKDKINKLQNGSRMETYHVFNGVDMAIISLYGERVEYRHDEFDKPESMDGLMEINYCRDGRIGWEMRNGNVIHLGQGDFSLNTMRSGADSVITLPNGYYEGLMICIDLETLSASKHEMLTRCGISGNTLYRKFSQDGKFTSFEANHQTEEIFSAFFDQPEHLQSTYWYIKTIELLLFLEKIELSSKHQLTQYRSYQVELIRKVHNNLIENINQRITIDELAKQYLISPTTLKQMFKTVYGNSIAAHIKEHRMEKAAELLLATDLSVAEIARAVGYESQSKFGIVFKEFFGVSPSEYRKNKHNS